MPKAKWLSCIIPLRGIPPGVSDIVNGVSMPAKILIIDDHEPTRNLIETILSRKGYHTLSASSGPAGLTLAAAEQPDLVLLDLTMPGMDGFEVCRHLRAQNSLSHIPIIMFTAKSLATDKLSGFNAGADDYLVKPTTPAELLRRVSALLERFAGTSHARMHPVANQDIERLPDDALYTAPPLPVTPDGERSGCLVAVMGARGGAGATTLAINLAATLADQGQPATLVDLDMVQGHISIYLKQKLTTSLNNLMSIERDDLSLRLQSELLPAGNNLNLLLSQPNLDGLLPTLLPGQVSQLLTALHHPGHCTVVDVGRGLNPLARATLAQADQILLCSAPERVSLTAAKQLVSQIEALSLKGALHLVLVDFRERSTLPQSAIEHFLAVPVFEVVRINDYKLAHAVNSGLPLVRAYPDTATVAVFRQLCQQLVT